MSIRFGVIGLAHNHVYSLTDQLLNAGAEIAGVYSDDDAERGRFIEQFPAAAAVESAAALLDDDSIQLIVGFPLPDERPALGMEAMRRGKDFVTDKPGFTTLDQVTRVRAAHEETGRHYIVYFSERFASPSTVKAVERVEAGAIGQVVQMVGLGPHLLNAHTRPAWFFERRHIGGILNDLICHQIDQFLTFTGNTTADIVSSQVANFNHPDYPELDDYGDLLVRTANATGYFRVDWFTPAGLGVWGDVRLFLLGTDGYIEVRKNIDVQGRPGGNHLLLVDQNGQQHLDCSDVPLTFGSELVADVQNRTETAVRQEHCFVVSELAIRAQMEATILTPMR